MSAVWIFRAALFARGCLSILEGLFDCGSQRRVAAVTWLHAYVELFAMCLFCLQCAISLQTKPDQSIVCWSLCPLRLSPLTLLRDSKLELVYKVLRENGLISLPLDFHENLICQLAAD
jgi:hypothetical protein